MSANASLARDDAVKKSNTARAIVIFLTCAEADIALEASKEPRLDAILLALRSSIKTWKESHIAYESATKAYQAVLDSIDLA